MSNINWTENNYAKRETSHQSFDQEFSGTATQNQYLHIPSGHLGMIFAVSNHLFFNF